MQCGTPFTGLYTNSYGDISACTFLTHKLKNSKTKPVLAYGQIIEVQEQHLAGEVTNDNCLLCMNTHKKNTAHATNYTPLSCERGTKYANIAFGNKCNLACRMCDASNSTGYKNLYVDTLQLPKAEGFSTYFASSHSPDALYMYDRNNKEHFLTLFKELETLTFHGGEPAFYQTEMLELLESIPNLKSLLIHTSGMVRFKKSFLDYLKSRGFEVTFIVSLDGVGKVNDYIRVGSDFDYILKSLERLKGFALSVNTVSQVNNWVHLGDMAMWYSANRLKYNFINWNINANASNNYNSVSVAVDKETYEKGKASIMQAIRTLVKVADKHHRVIVANLVTLLKLEAHKPDAEMKKLADTFNTTVDKHLKKELR